VAARHHFGARLARLDAHLARLGAILLASFAVLVLVDIWEAVYASEGRAIAAIACACLVALALGHALGGPDAATRTALAVSCAARNAGLAMLVASLNSAPPAVMATLLAYLVVSALTVTPYLAWRRRSAA
jgi:BASS family bile acid:Na+ symporter